MSTKEALLTSILVASVLSQSTFTDNPWQLLLIFFAAYCQSMSKSFTSRARIRNNAAYHAIASIAESFTWFLTFRILVIEKMTLRLLLPYTAGTALGRVTGQRVAIRIERFIGAVADENKTSDEKDEKNSKKIVYLSLGLTLFASILQIALYPPVFSWLLFLLLISGFADVMCYSMRTWAQNNNKQSLIIVANILTPLVEFLKWIGLFGTNMPLEIFFPMVLVNTLGSMCGTYIFSKIGKRIGASADAHVKYGTQSNFSNVPYYVAGVLAVFNLIVWTPHGVVFTLIIIFLSILRSMAFTFVSRAGSRNHTIYHLCAALVSNGIWFLTLNLISITKIDLSLFLPFSVGSFVGGVKSVQFAMQIEKKIGALADTEKTVAIKKA